MRAFGVIALVVALLAVVPAAVRAHVGFEFEAAGTNVDPQSIPWYRRAFPKGYVMHDGGAWKLTTDDTKDAEYVVNPPYAEDLAGRQALCATLHAVSQDMTAMLAAYTGAGGNGVHNHAFAYRGHNYLPSNPTAFEMQITFGVQLSQARRMFAAMNVANFDFAQPNGFPFPFSITPALAACPLWGAHPLSQLSHEGQGFVLLIAAMRLGGNDNAMVYPSPKRHMDFIVHSKWALLANQLTAVHAPFGAAAPGGGAALAERAALLADDGAGRPWAANMADLLANWMMAAPGAPPVPNHAWTHGGVLGQNALGVNMYAGGWTELDIDMNVQFDAWVRGILTPGLLGTHSTDLLRNNPITKIGNRIGNLDKVDTVGGQPHIIIEARRLTTVTAATVESVSLAYYDWFTRWNRHALTGVAAPRRLMNVDAGAAFPLGPPYYTTAGNGCLTRVTNTCQAHGGLGGTWNALHTAITNAETARINGAGGVAACFLEHGTESQRSGSSSSGAQKLRTKVKAQKKKLRKAVAHTHVVSECGDGPTAKAAPKQQPVEPKGALPLAQSLAAFEQQFGADLKAHPEKVDPEVLEAIKFAEQHKGKAKH